MDKEILFIIFCALSILYIRVMLSYTIMIIMIKYFRLVMLDNESMATGSHPVDMKEHFV